MPEDKDIGTEQGLGDQTEFLDEGEVDLSESSVEAVADEEQSSETDSETEAVEGIEEELEEPWSEEAPKKLPANLDKEGRAVWKTLGVLCLDGVDYSVGLGWQTDKLLTRGARDVMRSDLIRSYKESVIRVKERGDTPQGKVSERLAALKSTDDLYFIRQVSGDNWQMGVGSSQGDVSHLGGSGVLASVLANKFRSRDGAQDGKENVIALFSLGREIGYLFAMKGGVIYPGVDVVGYMSDLSATFEDFYNLVDVEWEGSYGLQDMETALAGVESLDIYTMLPESLPDDQRLGFLRRSYLKLLKYAGYGLAGIVGLLGLTAVVVGLFSGRDVQTVVRDTAVVLEQSITGYPDPPWAGRELGLANVDPGSWVDVCIDAMMLRDGGLKVNQWEGYGVDFVSCNGNNLEVGMKRISRHLDIAEEKTDNVAIPRESLDLRKLRSGGYRPLILTRKDAEGKFVSTELDEFSTAFARTFFKGTRIDRDEVSFYHGAAEIGKQSVGDIAWVKKSFRMEFKQTAFEDLAYLGGIISQRGAEAGMVFTSFAYNIEDSLWILHGWWGAVTQIYLDVEEKRGQEGFLIEEPAVEVEKVPEPAVDMDVIDTPFVIEDDQDNSDESSAADEAIGF